MAAHIPEMPAPMYIIFRGLGSSNALSEMRGCANWPSGTLYPMDPIVARQARVEIRAFDGGKDAAWQIRGRGGDRVVHRV